MDETDDNTGVPRQSLPPADQDMMRSAGIEIFDGEEAPANEKTNTNPINPVMPTPFPMPPKPEGAVVEKNSNFVPTPTSFTRTETP